MHTMDSASIDGKHDPADVLSSQDNQGQLMQLLPVLTSMHSGKIAWFINVTMSLKLNQADVQT